MTGRWFVVVIVCWSASVVTGGTVCEADMSMSGGVTSTGGRAVLSRTNVVDGSTGSCVRGGGEKDSANQPCMADTSMGLDNIPAMADDAFRLRLRLQGATPRDRDTRIRDTITQ